jgi:signal transduction histidine kinase
VNSKKLKAVVSLAVLALLGVLALQGFWIYSSYQTHLRHTRHRAHQAAVYTAKKLEQDHLDNLIQRRTRDKNIRIIKEHNTKEGKVERKVEIINSTNSENGSAESIVIINGDTLAKNKTASSTKMRFRPRTRIVDSGFIFQVDELAIDSVLRKEWKTEDLDLSYSFKIITDSLHDRSRSDKRRRSRVVVPLLRGMEHDYPVFLEVQMQKAAAPFPPWFWFQVVLSILFSGSMIWAFWYVVNGLYKQKRISEIKSDFINNVSHEFKTPLSTISLAADALKNEKVQKDSEQIESYASIVKSEGQKMNRQVEQILNASLFDNKGLQLDKVQTDLVKLLQDIQQSFQLIAEQKEGVIELRVPDTPIEIAVDYEHLNHAISNLVDNALKYSKAPVHVSLELLEKNNSVEISVTDNGIGMTKEEQKHLFEKFYRVSQGNLHPVKGFGLGLHYFKHVIDAHDGEITVESKKGKGTKFSIVLHK